MEVAEAIKIALPVFAEHKESNWQILEEALKRAGISDSFVGKLLEFMPLAFGRVFLDGMGIQFEDYYIRYNPQTKQEQRRKLTDEIIYRKAFEAASQIIAQQAAGEAFNAVVFRSSEVQAVNNALNGGSKPEDLVMSPPVLMAEEGDSKTGDLAPEQPKNWWKFWK